MLRIGLTGGIGAGKSTVADQLAALGAVVIEADQLAREVVAPGTDGLREVVEAFGRDLLDPTGALDRAAMAALVFPDRAARRRLESIIHPRVRARTEELTRAAPEDAIVVNAVPLLVEVGLAASYHLVLVVEATESTRMARLLRHRPLTEEQARARIRSQTSDEAREAAADAMLRNDGSLVELHAAVARLWHDRLVGYEENLRLRRPAPRSPRAMIVEPDPDWRARAARLTARLRRVAGEHVRIDHIGATSVPGLAAKDVVDVQVVVDDRSAAERLAERLPEAGLVRMAGEWHDRGRHGREFAKVMAGNADPAHAANVHIRPRALPSWRDALLLRDWLRATPDAVADYAAVKRRLAAEPHESIEEYAIRKHGWIDAALARADRWAADTDWRP